MYYSVTEGKLQKKMICHKGEISSLFEDKKNRLIVTAGWDGKIIVQKESKRKSLMRLQKGCHFGLEIGIMKVWVLTNFIATASNDFILIWTYDSIKLLGIWCFKDSEILAIEFFEDKPFLLSSEQTRMIVWDLRANKMFNYYQPIVQINTNDALGDKLSMKLYYIIMIISYSSENIFKIFT